MITLCHDPEMDIYRSHIDTKEYQREGERGLAVQLRFIRVSRRRVHEIKDKTKR